MTSKNKTGYMQPVPKDRVRELTEERDASVREMGKYHYYRARGDGAPVWDQAMVARNFALMHQSLIEGAFATGDSTLGFLYLTTGAEVCFVRTNETTGEYESALYVLAYEDGIAVMADTEDATLMAGTSDGLAACLALPCADLIQRETRRYYEIACSARKLETITACNGETIKVLFSK